MLPQITEWVDIPAALCRSYKIVPKAECYLFTGAADWYKKLKPKYAH